MIKNKPASIAERVKKSRDKKRDAGLVKMEIWTRPEHRNKIKKYVEDINK